MSRSEERADRGDARAGVVLLVCVKCGREHQYEGAAEPPQEQACEKCGNEVFRRFDATGAPSEAETDFRESTERDLATDDAEGDATDGDLHDLNNP